MSDLVSGPPESQAQMELQFTSRFAGDAILQLAPYVYLTWKKDFPERCVLSIVKWEPTFDATCRWVLARVTYDKGREKPLTAKEAYPHDTYLYANDGDDIVEAARPPRWTVSPGLYGIVPNLHAHAETRDEAIQEWLTRYTAWANAAAADAAVLQLAIK